MHRTRVEMQQFEDVIAQPKFHISIYPSKGRQVKGIPYSSSYQLNVDSTVWAKISSVILWNIWIDRCKNVFQQIKQNLVHCVKEIWSMLISILKGQYEDHFLKQQSFKAKWKDLFVFVERKDKMVWQYVPL